MKNYKKIITDVILNVFATAIPLIVLQMLILPFVAVKTQDDLYGLILTLISVITVISGSLGNGLNNIRLIKNNLYEKTNLQGDFSVLLLAEEIVGFIAVFIAIQKYRVGIVDFALILLLAFLWLGREYFIVAFRLNLNFKGIVINNLMMVLGYLFGLLLFVWVGYWQLIYISGLLFSILYIRFHSAILREKFVITPLFKTTLYELLFLIFASLINNLLNYADRIIIYPLIGGTAVSIYYASTLFGKIVSTAVSPLNSVVLSYLSKKESLNKNLFGKVLFSSAVIACFGYVICRTLAMPALTLLYPQWAEESIKYVPVTTWIAMLTMMTSVISPFLLKFCAMKWQVVINAIVLLVYLSCSMILYQSMGLMGFCLGILLSNIIKLLIMIGLGLKAGR